MVITRSARKRKAAGDAPHDAEVKPERSAGHASNIDLDGKGKSTLESHSIPDTGHVTAASSRPQETTIAEDDEAHNCDLLSCTERVLSGYTLSHSPWDKPQCDCKCDECDRRRQDLRPWGDSDKLRSFIGFSRVYALGKLHACPWDQARRNPVLLNPAVTESLARFHDLGMLVTRSQPFLSFRVRQSNGDWIATQNLPFLSLLIPVKANKTASPRVRRVFVESLLKKPEMFAWYGTHNTRELAPYTATHVSNLPGGKHGITVIHRAESLQGLQEAECEDGVYMSCSNGYWGDLLEKMPGWLWDLDLIWVEVCSRDVYDKASMYFFQTVEDLAVKAGFYPAYAEGGPLKLEDWKRRGSEQVVFQDLHSAEAAASRAKDIPAVAVTPPTPRWAPVGHLRNPQPHGHGRTLKR